MKDDWLMFAGAIVGYIGARLLDDPITHHANPLGLLVPGLATPACSGKCKATCSGSKCTDSGCGKSIACKNPALPAPKPTAASFLPNQGVFASAPLPNSRASKTPVPPKTTTTTTPTPLGTIVPGLATTALTHASTLGHFTKNFDYTAGNPGVNGLTSTVTATKDNGATALKTGDWSIYTTGLYSQSKLPTGGPKNSAEVIFNSQNPPNPNLDGIFVAANGNSTKPIIHKFAIQQIQGHVYSVGINTNGKTVTYSVTDHTAGTPPDTFTDSNPTHNKWDVNNAVVVAHELHTADGVKRDPLTERRFIFTPGDTTIKTNTGGSLNTNPISYSLCSNTTGSLVSC
jgi:hypothetical protein